jgi:hypothetical protein
MTRKGFFRGEAARRWQPSGRDCWSCKPTGYKSKWTFRLASCVMSQSSDRAITKLSDCFTERGYGDSESVAIPRLIDAKIGIHIDDWTRAKLPDIANDSPPRDGRKTANSALHPRRDARPDQSRHPRAIRPLPPRGRKRLELARGRGHDRRRPR